MRLWHLPRLLLTSHLLHQIFPPKRRWHRTHQSGQLSLAGPPGRLRAARMRFDLAIHLRRGDKLTETRDFEKIALWDEPRIVARASELLSDKLSKLAAGHAAGSQARADAAGIISRRGRRHHRTPRIFLASDDNAFAASLASALVASLGAEVVRPTAFEPSTNHSHSGSHWSYMGCDESCVPPLIELVDAFARSDHLILSTKSNIGAFLLAWWPAANGDRMANFTDMDGGLKPTDLTAERTMCALTWGSRRGVCDHKPDSAALLRGCLQESFFNPSVGARRAKICEGTHSTSCRPQGRNPRDGVRWPVQCCVPWHSVAT